jgi:DNA helicase-2/ATP-dependent DNA helicase PcrA
MSKSILEGLNPSQKEAVTHNGGPLLIIAGAGSGKTRVITHKFAYLAQKSSPNTILAVTFTNKAAGEMKERIGELSRKDLRGAWIGTFHSQCNRILRKEIQPLGYKNDFSIYDEEDQCTLIRHILKEFKIYEALYRGILSRISALKAAGVTPEAFLADGDGFGFEERLARVYVRYQDELKRCNALDYDDLIMLTVRLFQENPRILEKYQNKFKHVLVDEFQDTNSSQYELVKLLGRASRSLAAVGDDDQSIYGFRGASVMNILNFEKDFPDAAVVKLEQNYRCTKNILAVSDSIIKDNDKRRQKTLWCDRDPGELVRHCWFGSEDEEAKYIAKLLKELYLKGQYDYSDCAVLYRINVESRALEDALRHERIPYRVVGSVSFYQRKEIKDITAYMRLVLNRDDNVSLRRVVNVPPRGIGASTLAKVEQVAKKKNGSLFAAIKGIVKGGSLISSTKEKLNGFASVIEDVAAGSYKNAADMLRNIYIKTGYSDYVDDDRAENVKELIESAEGRDIKEFVDSLSLVTSLDEAGPEGSVSLLTLHGAKGLEFPVVCLSGLEEGVVPYFKAETPQEIAEERRLLYVGMTRAKDMLVLTGAGRRRLFAKVQEQEPSRFLGSLPDVCCLRIEKRPEALEDFGSRRARKKAFKPVGLYKVGARVRHPKWGVGVVRDCYGNGDDQKITVNFPSIGVKRLALKFANLERVT